jgi:hypothetical protein
MRPYILEQRHLPGGRVHHVVVRVDDEEFARRLYLEGGRAKVGVPRALCNLRRVATVGRRGTGGRRRCLVCESFDIAARWEDWAAARPTLKIR